MGKGSASKPSRRQRQSVRARSERAVENGLRPKEPKKPSLSPGVLAALKGPSAESRRSSGSGGADSADSRVSGAPAPTGVAGWIARVPVAGWVALSVVVLLGGAALAVQLRGRPSDSPEPPVITVHEPGTAAADNSPPAEPAESAVAPAVGAQGPALLPESPSAQAPALGELTPPAASPLPSASTPTGTLGIAPGLTQPSMVQPSIVQPSIVQPTDARKPSGRVTLVPVEPTPPAVAAPRPPVVPSTPVSPKSPTLTDPSSVSP